MPPGNDGEARANSISPGGEGAQQQRVRATCKVFEQRWCFTHIADYDFFASVIVQIAYGQTARGVSVGNTRPALRGEIEELAVTAVPIEKSWLLVLFGGVASIYFGIDMAIRHD